MDKPPLRQIAERIVQNLEEMALPKRPHGEREDMIGEVEGVLRTMLAEFGFVQLVKP
jgi:hypothetical protein